MSKIEQMLKNEKVEWKKLGEVCEILDSKRQPIAKSKRTFGKYPYFGANGVQDYVEDYIFDGNFILMGEDGSVINKENSPVLHWIEGSKIWVNNHAHVLGNKDKKYDLKYIYYYLQTIDVSNLVKGTPPKINQENMKKIPIPIPPLPVQEKIVKILDKFTEYATELQARSSQYEYYRDMLLGEENLRKMTGNDDKVYWKKLGEVVNIVLGGTPKTTNNDYWYNGTIPWMSSGEVNKKIIYETENFITQKGYDHSSATLVPPNSTVIALAGQGKTRGIVARIKIELSTNQSLATLIPKESLNNDYLYYYLDGQYQKLREISSGDGSRGGLNKKILSNYPILLPPLPVQEKIVSILDRFERLLTDIHEGLPREMELRQKQYEYYRDKLLDFSQK